MTQHDTSGSLLSTTMERARDELGAYVKSNHRSPCEAVLEDHPTLATEPDYILELIYLEFILRQDQGLPTEALIAEYLERFPKFYDDIVKLFRVDAAFHNMGVENPTLEWFSSADTIELEESIGSIGDYKLVEILGKGGMGVVYRAIQGRLGRAVAIKTIADEYLDTLSIARFQKEAELASSLQHPNIAQIYEVGSCNEIPFYSMEYVSGGSLAETLRDQPLRPDLAARLLAVLSRAVHYAHSQNIIHRDLKPGNILLSPSSRPEALDFAEVSIRGTSHTLQSRNSGHIRFEPKIVDFGLAQNIAENEPSVSRPRAAGTPSYMAPEQIDAVHGLTGPASDIYALGAILYHALVGRPPFSAATPQETLRQVQFDELVSPRQLQPKIAGDLETICLKCLRKSPQGRYASADLLAQDLQRFLEGKPILARPASVTEVVFKWGKRHPSLVGLMAAMLVTALLTTWLWRRSEQSLAAELQERQIGKQLDYAHNITLAHLEYESNNVERTQELLAQCDPQYRNWEWEFLDQLCQEPIWQCTSPSKHRLSEAALSPDGRYVATAHGAWGVDYDQTVYVWDTKTNRLLWELKGHPMCSVMDVRFSPDSARLLSSAVVWTTPGGSGGVIEWDISTGKMTRVLAKTNAHASAYSPDGGLIAIGEANGQLRILDARSGSVIKQIVKHRSIVLSLAFAPDGRYLISTARDGTVGIWDTASWNSVTYMTQMGDPRIAAWSPDMRKVQIVSFGGQVDTFLWNGKALHNPARQARAYTQIVRYAPDSRSYVTAVMGDPTQLHDAASGRVIRQFHGHRGNVRSLVFDRSGYRLLTAGVDGSCSIWDLTRSDLHLNAQTTAGRIAAVDFHPSSKQYAVAIRKELARTASSSGKPRIEIWETERHSLVARFEGHRDWLNCVRYSPDGKYLISGSDDKTVRVWDVDAQSATAVFTGHPSAVIHAAFLDEQRAISVDKSGQAIIWDIASRRILNQWQVANRSTTESEIPLSAETHSASKILVVAEETEITFWDLQSGAKLAIVPAPSPIYHLQFDQSGSRLSVSTERADIEIFDTSRLKSKGIVALQLTLKGHTEAVTCTTFSSDGSRLVSVSEDESVRMFELTTGRELLKRMDRPGIDHLVVFSNSGRQFVHVEGRWMHLYSLDEVDPNLGLDPTEKLINFHRKQLSEARSKLQSFSCSFHSRVLSTLQPEVLSHRLDLADSLADLGDYDAATQSLIDVTPNSVAEKMYRLSSLLRVALLQGDRPTYQDYCLELERLARDANEDWIWNNVGWYAALQPNLDIRLDAILDHIEPILSSSHSGTYANTAALMYYRMGLFQASLATTQMAKHATEVKVPDPLNDLVECLALCQEELSFQNRNFALPPTKVADAIPNTAQIPDANDSSARRLEIIRDRINSIEEWENQRQQLAENLILGKLDDWRIQHTDIKCLMDELKDLEARLKIE
ncbi:MAG: protein kinase [Planctomycetales bacterium]|nr:protein kinase [Planctomycetales bacterium]